AFDQALAATLAILGGAFLLTLVFQVLFGLRPLKRMLGALHEVRTGRADRIEGDYPIEIAPLAAEVNALIDTNREIVERARTHVGNLAHALKTPISVLQNEAARGHGAEAGLAAKVTETAQIMKDQVAHHLERARMAARASVVTTVEEVEPIVARIAATLAKVYRAKGVAVEAEVADGLRFRGERQDLEEILGNLVDNGCKWARTLVEIAVAAVPGAAGERDYFDITIDDDGPGLTPEQQTEALKRGKRLDETQPGSGLGLSIVAELVGLYGGRLTLGRSPFGGAALRGAAAGGLTAKGVTGPRFRPIPLILGARGAVPKLEDVISCAHTNSSPWALSPAPSRAAAPRRKTRTPWAAPPSARWRAALSARWSATIPPARSSARRWVA
ncbi:ATP-binding protein, partial [Ancylobacter sp.]|uniref:ATP-binding protein n=1 Tax=Ancylobacter sp. TaxID=1872567 RepID=UPI003C7DE311